MKVRTVPFSPSTCHSLLDPNVLNNSHEKRSFGNTSSVPRLSHLSTNCHVVWIPLSLFGTVLLRQVVQDTVLACNYTGVLSESWLRTTAKSSGTELWAASKIRRHLNIVTAGAGKLPGNKHYAEMWAAVQINIQADGLYRQAQHSYHPNYMEAVNIRPVINRLFNDAVGKGDHTAWNGRIISELEGTRKELTVT